MNVLNLYRGEHKIFEFSGDRDLTGTTIYLTVRPYYPPSSTISDEDAFIRKITGSGIIATGTNVFEVEFFPDDTNLAAPGIYYYGVECTDISGGPYVLDKGVIIIEPDVVRSG